MEKENMNIVIVGHVDHGKSTLIGRLLYDTNSLPKEKVEEIKSASKRISGKMEFAFLTDSLREEIEGGLTIETTQIFFKTNKRNYTIIDAPGHKEFLKNMITGASQAEAAILLVDVNEGIKEQTKRHAYLLRILGVKQLIVAINKMDLVNYDEIRFNKVKKELLEFLNEIGIKPTNIIPISAYRGENIAKKSGKIVWYNSLSILDALDNFKVKQDPIAKELRFPIQDTYMFNSKKIFVGRIESGRLKQGEEVSFLPSNKNAVIKTIEVFNKNKKEAEAQECIGITLDKPLIIERGEVIYSNTKPQLTNEFKAKIFWMAKNPFNVNEKIKLRCSTQEVDCNIKKIERKINSSTLEILKGNDNIKETEVGEVVIKTERPIVIENFNETEELGRFVLVNDQDIGAGGIIV